MASFLGTLGEVLLKIAFLKFLRRLSAKLPHKVNDGASSRFSWILFKMCDVLTRAPCTAYITSSVRLAREYLRLGKTSRAGIVLAQAESRIQAAAKNDAPSSPVAQIAYSLGHAEYLAMLGSNDRRCVSLPLVSALRLSLTLSPLPAACTPTRPPSQSQTGSRRTCRRRAARPRSSSGPCSSSAQVWPRACAPSSSSARCVSSCSLLTPRSHAHGSSRRTQGELSRSVAPAMQAMRLGTRALNNMSRLAPSPAVSPPTTDSTFSAPPVDHKTALADAAPINKRKAGTTLPGGAHAGLSWQLSEVRPLPRTVSLCVAVLMLSSCRVCSTRPSGSPSCTSSAARPSRPTSSLSKLSTSPRTSRRQGRWRERSRSRSMCGCTANSSTTPPSSSSGSRSSLALCVPRPLLLHSQRFPLTLRSCAQTSCPEMAEFRRLQADLHQRARLQQEAFQFCLAAQSSLDAFISSASEGDAGSS